MAKKEIIGVCGLCRQEKALQKSHLMSKGLYRLCREVERDNPNPVVATRAGKRITSDQITGHFLCKECESRFDERGENWVLPRCAHQGGEFKLRELLSGTPPLAQDTNWVAFDLWAVSSTAVESLLFFAASVLWRCSARRWKDRAHVVDTISLGPYEEEFRRYLLGETSFPAHATMVVKLSDEIEPDVTISFPSTTKVKGLSRHKFQIPGIIFSAFVGRRRLPDSDMGSLDAPAPHAVFMANLREDELFQGILNLTAEATRRSRP